MATRIAAHLPHNLWSGAALGFTVACAICLVRATLAATILLGWVSFPTVFPGTTAMPMSALLSSVLCALFSALAAAFCTRRSGTALVRR